VGQNSKDGGVNIIHIDNEAEILTEKIANKLFLKSPKIVVQIFSYLKIEHRVVSRNSGNSEAIFFPADAEIHLSNRR
jgi:hypothetical protein